MSRIPRTIWIQAIRKCGGRCWYCGREALTIDHATPKSRGGTNALLNLLPACTWCNHAKGDMSIRCFRRYLRHCIGLKLMTMGYAGVPKLHTRINVVFYGEGNTSAFHFSEFLRMGMNSDFRNL